MSLLELLENKEVWDEFLGFRTLHDQLTFSERKQLESFVCEKRYIGDLSPGIPEKKLISKMGSAKKRVVYSFPDDVTWKLKLLAYLLYKYDGRLSEHCYSFRRRVTAGTAFRKIRSISDLDGKYVLKADIHNYFNSIPPLRLTEVLEDVIDDDPELLEFMRKVLLDDRCLYNGEIICEQKGAMAGVPLASFFANFYLLSLDQVFESLGADYFRYSDDILVFADSEEQIRKYYDILLEHITSKGLSLNPDKLVFYSPGDGFEFLGFSCKDGRVDLSEVTVQKMKDKIRRKAHSLWRKRKRMDYSFEKAATIMIRSFDNKLYDMTGRNEFTWTRFYFPVITCADGLSEIDRYMVQYLRFLKSGKHCKGNYSVTYDQLKNLGYTSLVNEYYTWKKENRKLLKSAIDNNNRSAL